MQRLLQISTPALGIYEWRSGMCLLMTEVIRYDVNAVCSYLDGTLPYSFRRAMHFATIAARLDIWNQDALILLAKLQMEAEADDVTREPELVVAGECVNVPYMAEYNSLFDLAVYLGSDEAST